MRASARQGSGSGKLEARAQTAGNGAQAPAARRETPEDREAKRQAQIEARRRDRALKALKTKVAELEDRIAACETAIKDLERAMASPGFYDDRTAAQPVVDRHQALMWEVGDLMHQWEQLQGSLEEQ